MQYDDWRGVAERLRSEMGIDDGDGDGEAIAAHCGLVLCPGDEPGLDGRWLTYQRSAGPLDRQAQVCELLGLWALRREGAEESVDGARYVGARLAAGPGRQSGVMATS
jgi:hypothetical protein